MDHVLALQATATDSDSAADWSTLSVCCSCWSSSCDTEVF